MKLLPSLIIGLCFALSFLQAEPAISRFQYNIHNELISSTDAEGHTTRHLYERTNRLTKTTIDPLGNTVSTIYNSRNQPIQIIHTDAVDKKLSERTLHYDPNGNCIETRDWTEEGPEICTKRRYGINNRLEELIEAFGTPEAKRTTWEYDSCQRLVSIHKPNGVMLSYTYDTASRIARIHASDNSVDDQYAYDEMNRLIQVCDKDGCLLKRTYDLWDRCIEETLSNGATIQRSYDPQGRCVKLLLPDNTPIDYAYDAYALKTVTYGNYQHKYLERDLAGRLRKSQLANEATLTFIYDRTGKITSIETDQWKSQAKYDASGRLQERTIHDADGIFTETFAYDGKHQLTEEPGHTYSYDPLGNCKQVDDTSCAHNVLNQTLHNNHGDYAYDANGNLTSFKRDWPLTCRYDAYDRLVEVCCAERFKAAYRYDAFHRRIEKQMWHWSDNQWQRGPTRKFIYDDQNEIGALDDEGNISELRLLGTGFGAEIGAAVVIELDGTPYVPVHDEHGNIVTLLDFGNDIVAATRYSAFGATTSDIPSPWGYASKRLDPETHWIYFGRRYYSPTLRRWTTADPKGEADGPNLYAYLLNDPWNGFDLYGELTELRSREWRNWSPTKAFHWTGRSADLSSSKFAYDLSLKSRQKQFLKEGIHLFEHIGGPGNSPMRYLLPRGLSVKTPEMLERGRLLGNLGIDVYGTWREFSTKAGDLLYGAKCALASDSRMNQAMSISIRSLYQNTPDRGCLNAVAAHSNGASELYNGLKYLEKWGDTFYKNDLIVRTWGPACFIQKDQAKNVLNLMAPLDYVTWFANSIQCTTSLFKESPHIQRIKQQGGPFGCHSFNSQGYSQSMMLQTHALIEKANQIYGDNQ